MKTYRDLQGDGGSDIVGQVVAQRRRVAERLAAVRNVVAVTSGKGGVGKSTVSVRLAGALAAGGGRVAILDADLNGPSIPSLLGMDAARPEWTDDGVVPPSGPLGIRAISTSLFLGGEDQPLRYEGPSGDAYTWRPTAEATTLRELLAGTAWGELDWLVVDTPPGADRLPTVADLLPRLDAVVAVTLRSAVSLQVVRRALTAAAEAGLPVAGLVENMAGYRCGSCDAVGTLFGPGDAVAELARDLGLPLLGSFPFEPGHADGPWPMARSPEDWQDPEARQLADRLATHVERRREASDSAETPS